MDKIVEESGTEERPMEKKIEWHHVVTMENLGGLNRKIVVAYDTVGVKMGFDKACALIGQHVQIKGFRKGKAPKALIQTHLCDRVADVAGELLAREGYMHACFEQKIMALGEPKIENKKFDVDGTFRCEVFVEIRPEIKPFGYAGLNLKDPKVDAEHLFEHALADARNQHASEMDCDEIQADCTAIVDFVASIDGKEISSGKDQHFLIQAGQSAPFGENLFGMKVGETQVCELPAPEETEYVGKVTTVQVTLTGITKKVLPTDSELVERTQALSYDDLVQMLKKKAELDAMQKARQILEEEVVDKLLEMHQFDAPLKWVEEEEKYFMKQLGMGNAADDKIKEHIHKMAERNVRRSFILEAIYEAEPALMVTKEEFDATIEAEAESAKVSRFVLLDDLKKNGMLDGVLAMIKHKKVMDFIIGQANMGENGLEGVSQCCDIPENPLG